MRRHIPGLHSRQQAVASNLDGLFLVRVEQASYRWHPQKPFLTLRLIVLEPKISEPQFFSGRLYCTERVLWKLNWFLRDFGYDMELLSRDQIEEKALVGLRGGGSHLTHGTERPFLSESGWVRSGYRMGWTRL
jgi:hypothetical protein